MFNRASDNTMEIINTMKIHTEKRTKHSIDFYENEFVHAIPSRVEGMVGERWTNIRALPLHMSRLIRPKR